MKQTITTFLSLILVALLGDFQQINTGHNEPKTTIDVPRSTVTVEVSNPGKSKLLLFGDESSGYVKLAEFEGKDKFAFEIPHGRYALLDVDNAKYFAVPAIRFGSSPKVKVTISNFKHEDGWAWIPPGPSIIGDTLGIGAEDERPVRVLDIPGFWLAKNEVTNKQYAKFLSAQDYFDPTWIDLHSRKCLIRKKLGQDGYEPSTVDKENAASMPVVMVSHEGASQYCQWLTKETGVVHRLPNETEWEKAARGPLQQVYAYGDTYCASAANQESGELMPVGSFSANGYGLCDMTGNVFEWMANQYDPTKKTRIMNQALRGGSFVLDGMYLRNSFRMRQSPDVMTDDIGFRVLREVPSTTNSKDSK